MSTPTPEGQSQPHRIAGRMKSTIMSIQDHIHLNLSPADLNELGRALVSADHALDSDSVHSAIKNEDASHILARISLIDARAQALLVASDYLVHLAGDLQRHAHELRDTVEGIDDGDL